MRVQLLRCWLSFNFWSDRRAEIKVYIKQNWKWGPYWVCQTPRARGGQGGGGERELSAVGSWGYTNREGAWGLARWQGPGAETRFPTGCAHLLPSQCAESGQHPFGISLFALILSEPSSWSLRCAKYCLSHLVLAETAVVTLHDRRQSWGGVNNRPKMAQIVESIFHINYLTFNLKLYTSTRILDKNNDGMLREAHWQLR